MREILFRGKSVKTGNWIYGHYVNCCDPQEPDNTTRHYIVEYPGSWSEIYTGTLGQWTGLTDKDGEKIFEGDLIHVHTERKENENYIFAVCFGEKEFSIFDDCSYIGFYLSPANGHTKDCAEHGLRNDMLFWLTEYKCKINGNIHNNAYLLRATGEDIGNAAARDRQNYGGKLR